MIWKVYNLDSDKPVTTYFLCSYSIAERLAFRRFGREVMVIGYIADLRRKRMAKWVKSRIRMPVKKNNI